ncbi:hypothetical protein NN561_012756 [Cricetulus griseus]
MLDRPEKGPHGRPAGRYFRSVLTQAGASCDVGGSAQRLSRGLPTFCGAVFLVFDGSVESRRQMVTCGQKPLVCFSSVYPDVVKLRTDRSATTSGSRAWCACSRTQKQVGRGPRLAPPPTRTGWSRLPQSALPRGRAGHHGRGTAAVGVTAAEWAGRHDAARSAGRKGLARSSLPSALGGVCGERLPGQARAPRRRLRRGEFGVEVRLGVEQWREGSLDLELDASESQQLRKGLDTLNELKFYSVNMEVYIFYSLVKGANASALEKEIGPEQFPVNEHYFGLVNFGNTCYCNSVLQALYFCRPFREKVLAYKSQPRKKENLLTCLADLFHSIATQKKKVGVIPPKKFITRLRKENELFDNYMQQDAHEFLNYLLNTIADILQEERKQEKQNGRLRNGDVDTEDNNSTPDPTWVHEIFQGTLTNETRCLTCETGHSVARDRVDTVSVVGIEQYCVPSRRMKVKKLPMILALHLKRFKYMDQLHRYTKLSYRVVFPLELRLFNTSGDATNPDRMYDLVAVVVHCGSGPNRGHYIAIVKSHDFWLLFDDDIVEKIDAQAIEEFYGLTSDISKNSESGYILFYQSRD